MKNKLINYKTETVLYDGIYGKVVSIIKKKSKYKQNDTALHFSMFEDTEKGDAPHDSDNWKVIIPLFNQLFAKGKCVFSAKYEGDYRSRIYINPSWEEVVYEAHKCVKANWPTDHVFLEAVDLEKTDKHGVKHYEFWFGS